LSDNYYIVQILTKLLRNLNWNECRRRKTKGEKMNYFRLCQIFWLMWSVVMISACQRVDLSQITVPGDFPTLHEAYEKVKDEGVIFLKSGKHVLPSKLMIDRAITFRGEEGTVIECSDSVVFEITGSAPTFENLTIHSTCLKDPRQTGVLTVLEHPRIPMGEECIGVKISGGTPKFQSCVITAQNGSGMRISGKQTNPEIKTCVIKDCGEFGVYISDEAQGTFTDCEITQCQMVGFRVENLANPTVTDSKFHHSTQGISVFSNGQGQFTNCEIYQNHGEGVFIFYSGNPTFRQCKIYQAKNGSGVSCTNFGMGKFIDCEIYDNANEKQVMSECILAEGGNPEFIRCKIYGSNTGVLSIKRGLGSFTQCEIKGKIIGVVINEKANPVFLESKICDSKRFGVMVHDKGLGSFTDCEISNCSWGGISVAESEAPTTVTRCKISNGKIGVMVLKLGKCILENNTLENNLQDWLFLSPYEVSGSRNTPELPGQEPPVTLPTL
ncbi:MAG: right-handed parallel beta-helix repeat-containing protein, partial [Planctomycetia bacterium]|nr:right-handed parallel beta-helix repeat-containing protein [Planctomycetia bacterium]